MNLPRLSDIIENYLLNIIEDAEKDMIEIQRNLLAQKFNCSPSQINYVLTTRFGQDKGYMIESRRGGGGYVKIYKVQMNQEAYLETVIREAIGNSLTRDQAMNILQNLEDEKLIKQNEKQMMMTIMTDRALTKVSYQHRNEVRADLLKEMLLALLQND